MEVCPHINSFAGPIDAAIFDPSRWQCSQCGTTEWVWACLSCANIACGRMNEEHAVQHYYSTKHPLAVEINEKYVYCYECDEYVLGDNERRDIETIRSALTDIGTLSPEEVRHKGGKLLKTFSHQQEFSRTQADDNDRLITAVCHHRKTLLGKAMAAWQTFVLNEKQLKLKRSTTAIPSMVTRARTNLFNVKKRTLVPGVTGLRNLGNTCYINSIIQSLGHLEDFREFFCQIIFGLFSPSGTPLPGNSPNNSSPSAMRNLLRLNTIDYFQHLSHGGKNNKKTADKNADEAYSPPHKKKKGGGLNGGGSDHQTGSDVVAEICATPDQSKVTESASASSSILEAKAHALKALSLCQEMHGLLRVLWSGKWAQVSPHGFLHALWRTIPAFKGHLQHDAQEFLCELLDKMSQEIENLPQCKGLKNMIDQSFRGEFVSQVTCMGCSNVSCRYEPFLDVSLEFPRRFQSTSGQIYRNMCHLTEMLSSFTDVEDLEPLSYSCENCNKKRKRASRQKETKTNARKQLLVSQLPEILRLHLKRFRWCGRNNREKIGTHVAFDEELDMSPFCVASTHTTTSPPPMYRLSAVVVHHGAGFRAGHYTAYAYNNSAGSWIHCNDSRVQLVTTEEVLASQAYILFYTRGTTTVCLDDLPPSSTSEDTDCLSSNISSVPDIDAETLLTLRRGETEHLVDEDISLSFHRDPGLVRRLSLTSAAGSVASLATTPRSSTRTGSLTSPRKDKEPIVASALSSQGKKSSVCAPTLSKERESATSLKSLPSSPLLLQREATEILNNESAETLPTPTNTITLRSTHASVTTFSPDPVTSLSPKPSRGGKSNSLSSSSEDRSLTDNLIETIAEADFAPSTPTPPSTAPTIVVQQPSTTSSLAHNKNSHTSPVKTRNKPISAPIITTTINKRRISPRSSHTPKLKESLHSRISTNCEISCLSPSLITAENIQQSTNNLSPQPATTSIADDLPSSSNTPTHNLSTNQPTLSTNLSVNSTSLMPTFSSSSTSPKAQPSSSSANQSLLTAPAGLKPGASLPTSIDQGTPASTPRVRSPRHGRQTKADWSVSGVSAAAPSIPGSAARKGRKRMTLSKLPSDTAPDGPSQRKTSRVKSRSL